jgi:hypothetical protein
MSMKIKQLRHPVSLNGQLLERIYIDQGDRARSSKSKYMMHVFYVYNDTDFQMQLETLRSKLESEYYVDVSMNPDHGHLSDSNKSDIDRICDYFVISIKDFWIYADNFYFLGSQFGDNKARSMIFVKDGALYIKIGADTTMKDIVAQSDLIKIYQQECYGAKNKRQRSINYDDLVYAVFKARKTMTFKQIYQAYEIGNLNGLDKKLGNLFKSEEDLERYYNKYRP